MSLSSPGGICAVCCPILLRPYFRSFPLQASRRILLCANIVPNKLIPEAYLVTITLVPKYSDIYLHSILWVKEEPLLSVCWYLKNRHAKSSVWGQIWRSVKDIGQVRGSLCLCQWVSHLSVATWSFIQNQWLKHCLFMRNLSHNPPPELCSTPGVFCHPNQISCPLAPCLPSAKKHGLHFFKLRIVFIFRLSLDN